MPTGQRNRRFGIPKVNQNPRPPNERRPNKVGRHPGQNPLAGGRGQQQPGARGGGVNKPGQGQGQGGGQGGGGGGGQGGGRGRQVRGLIKRLLNYENLPVNEAPSVAGTQTNLNPNAVQQQLGNNPANALAFSSFTPGPGQEDPRDSEYWANVNNLLFNTQSQLAANQLEGQRSQIDYQKGLLDFDTSRQRQQRQLGEQSMRQGLAYSGWHDVAEAEDTGDYLRDVEDYRTGYSREEQDRAAARSAMIQEFIAGERDETLGALGRYSDAQSARAEDEAPLYSPADIQRLEKLLKPKKKKKGGGGGGNRGGGNRGGNNGGGSRGGGGGRNKPRNSGRGSGPRRGGPR